MVVVVIKFGKVPVTVFPARVKKQNGLRSFIVHKPDE
jgi:hypothetical protein